MKKILSLGFIALILFSAALGQEDEILKLKEKIINLQNKGELGFRNFIFCSNIIGFASYVPLPKPVIDKNETLNSIDLEGKIPAGKYKFKAVLKDKLSAKSATQIADFEVR